MCGIFGLSVTRNLGYDEATLNSALTQLFKLSESRGKEAAGVAIATSTLIEVHKDSVSASAMLASRDYKQAFDRGAKPFFDADAGAEPTLTAVGHARLVTNGLQGIDANNQPVRRDDVVIVHNGIVVNADQLWAELAVDGIVPQAEVDTEVLAAIMSEALKAGTPIERSLRDIFSRIYGETSVAILLRQHNVLMLATNTGSVHYALTADRKGFVFASEETICAQLTHSGGLSGFVGAAIRQLAPGRGAILALDTFEWTEFDLAEEALSAPAVSPMLATQRRIEDKTERYRQAQQSMPRCTRCLMPETAAFVSFDAEGVCNECREYEVSKPRPKQELERLLNGFRRRDGSPDCVVAFADEQDAAYGLHLLKTVHGMNPVAISYNFGVDTELDQRNRARICGGLGIEHIYVSADIRDNRAKLNSDIRTWLANPRLEDIPSLAPSADRFVAQVDDILKYYDIPRLVTCRNPYRNAMAGWTSAEARNYSGALSGLRNDPGSVVTRALLGKPHISLFDDHAPSEADVREVLSGRYGWSPRADAPSLSLRGDGIAAFRDFASYTVAGFSAADMFRSAQIRDGVITREGAITAVQVENSPRWDSIRQFLDAILLDFDETIKTISSIQKKYLVE